MSSYTIVLYAVVGKPRSIVYDAGGRESGIDGWFLHQLSTMVRLYAE
jgi:hypothetical protein